MSDSRSTIVLAAIERCRKRLWAQADAELGVH